MRRANTTSSACPRRMFPSRSRQRAPRDQPEWTDTVRLRSERETLGRGFQRPPHRPVRERSSAIHHRRASSTTSTPKNPRQAPRWPRVFGGKPVAIAGQWSKSCASAGRAPKVRSWTTIHGRISVTVLRRAVPAIPRDSRQGRSVAHRRQTALRRIRQHLECLRAAKVSELERLREKEARRIVLKDARAADATAARQASGDS